MTPIASGKKGQREQHDPIAILQAENTDAEPGTNRLRKASTNTQQVAGIKVSQEEFWVYHKQDTLKAPKHILSWRKETLLAIIIYGVHFSGIAEISTWSNLEGNVNEKWFRTTPTRPVVIIHLTALNILKLLCTSHGISASWEPSHLILNLEK